MGRILNVTKNVTETIQISLFLILQKSMCNLKLNSAL